MQSVYASVICIQIGKLSTNIGKSITHHRTFLTHLASLTDINARCTRRVCLLVARCMHINCGKHTLPNSPGHRHHWGATKHTAACKHTSTTRIAGRRASSHTWHQRRHCRQRLTIPQIISNSCDQEGIFQCPVYSHA